MLVLSRSENESIVIVDRATGAEIARVATLRISRHKVRLGVTADQRYRIARVDWRAVEWAEPLEVFHSGDWVPAENLGQMRDVVFPGGRPQGIVDETHVVQAIVDGTQYLATPQGADAVDVTLHRVRNAGATQ